MAFHHSQNQSGQDVEALAVPDLLVPSGVGQQDPLQHNPVLLSLLATVRAAACAVKVLKREGDNIFQNDGLYSFSKRTNLQLFLYLSIK